MSEFNDLLEKLIKFRDERNWKQFHSPENLAKSISIEASELLENYQWGDKHANIDNIKEEVADIFGYLILFCNEMKIDLFKATKDKIAKNNEKYPINQSFGSSKKYNKLR